MTKKAGRSAIVAGMMLCVLAFLAPLALFGAESRVEGFAAYHSGDYARARQALESAAAQGDGQAMNLLGEMHATGKGGPKDQAKAYSWFKAGADKGTPDAQNNLGEMYASGLGVKPNPRAWHVFGTFALILS